MGKKLVCSSKKYDYAQMMRDFEKLSCRYPIEKQIIGYSAEGREIPAFCVGTGERRALLVGAHHAREYIASAYLMRVLEELCEQKRQCVQGTEVETQLKRCKLFFVPMLNPDGVEISIHGARAAKNPGRVRRMKRVFPAYCAWKANANGVDLNRHYPCLWQEKHSAICAPASEGFKGSAPAQESEVRALMKLCQKEDFLLAATFHAKGEEIYWADRNSEKLVPQARRIAQRLHEVTGYTLMPVSADPGQYAAGFENWFRQEFRRPALLFELAPFTGGVIPHDMQEFDRLVWEKMSLFIYEFMKFI